MSHSCLYACEPTKSLTTHKTIEEKYRFFFLKPKGKSIERGESLLCVVEEDGRSIDKANNDQHNKKNEEGNNSKSKKPSWMNITKTRPPSLVFVYISRPLFLYSVDVTVTAAFPAKAFVFEYKKSCDHSRYSHPYTADHYPPIKPVAWFSCVRRCWWMPSIF